tara:strand:- start:107 stop:478 length:372 start_codon:yes stop_codon:yes gene_type:complete
MDILFIINIFSFIYSSVYRRNIKRKYLLCGLVQDHHIIPREFKNILNYSNSLMINHIDSSKNLIIMPTKYGKLFLKTNRTIHENGHKNYNKYIKYLIEQNYSIDFILKNVKQELRSGSNHILN